MVCPSSSQKRASLIQVEVVDGYGITRIFFEMINFCSESESANSTGF